MKVIFVIHLTTILCQWFICSQTDIVGMSMILLSETVRLRWMTRIARLRHNTAHTRHKHIKLYIHIKYTQLDLKKKFLENIDIVLWLKFWILLAIFRKNLKKYFNELVINIFLLYCKQKLKCPFPIFQFNKILTLFLTTKSIHLKY